MILRVREATMAVASCLGTNDAAVARSGTEGLLR
jgi:hypothetical protein